MRLSVIVPATDDPPTLGRCRDALEAALGPSDELIVVDRPARLSPAGARNLGVAQAAGEVVVFVDADVVVHADALSRIRQCMTDRPHVTAVFGAYDDTPDVPTTVSAFRNLLHHHVHTEAAGPAETFWSGLGAVRRDAFLAAGGFDADRYPHPSIEDVELGGRLVAGGARMELLPEVRGTHLKRWTLGSMVATDFGRRGVPWVELLLRQGATSTSLNLGWRHRLSALLSLGVVLAGLARRPRALLAGALGLVALNGSFYRLLVRRLGVGRAAVGVALHGVHHLVAVAAVPTGIVRHLRAGRRP